MPVNIRRSLTISMLERYTATVIQFGSTLILARLLTPEEIGIFSIAAAIAGLAHVLRDFGVSNYLIQEKELTTNRIRAALALTCGIAWTMGVVLVALSPLFATFYHNPGVRKALLVVAATFFFLPVSSTILAVLRREMRFGALYRIRTAGAAVHAATSVTLAWFGFGFMSLAWASLAGILTTATLAVFQRPDPAHFMPGLREIRRVFSFGSRSSASALLQEMGDNAWSLIAGRMIGFAPVGLLSRANGIVGMFGRLVLQGVQPVILPAFAAKDRAGENVAASCLKAIGYLGVLAWPFSLFLFVMADPLILVLFGKQWTGAVPLLRILALNGLFLCVTPVAYPVLIALGRIDLNLRIQLVTRPVGLLMVLFAAMHSIEAVAAAIVVSNGLTAGLSYTYLMRIINVPLNKFGRTIGHIGLVTIITMGPAASGLWLSRWLLLPSFLELLLVSASFAIGWLVAVVWSRHPLRDEFSLLQSVLLKRWRHYQKA